LRGSSSSSCVWIKTREVGGIRGAMKRWEREARERE